MSRCMATCSLCPARAPGGRPGLRAAKGVQDSVSHDRLRGIRIFNITDITKSEYIANVKTCRGSHTHTVVE